MKEMKYKTRI